MSSDRDRSDSDPGLVRRVARIITGHRRIRRLDGEPLRQDFIGGRHAVSYIRHLARGNAIPHKRFYEGVMGREGRSAAVDDREGRSAAVDDREGRSTTVDNREGRSAAAGDREGRSAAAGDREGRSAAVIDQRPPVLLIHGFMGTRGSMFVLEQRLVRDGFCVVSFDLGLLNVRDIRASAFLIHRKIQSILAQTSVKRIDIVGHSMGGLIGLYYIKRLGGHQRVRRMIMMGSPVRGTWTALLGVATMGLISSSSWQLLPGSRFLDELSQSPLPDDVECFTIAAERDWVCPPEVTRMEGAHYITVPLGHSSLVVSEEVYRKVLWALRKEDAPR